MNYLYKTFYFIFIDQEANYYDKINCAMILVDES